MYDTNWRQKALDAGKDQNSPEFAEMRRLESQGGGGGGSPAPSSFSPGAMSTPGYDPNWRQKALDIGDDQNSPKYASMRAMESAFNASRGAGTGNYTPLPASILNPPKIDLPSVYKNLVDTSNISGLQSEYDTVTKEIEKLEAAKNEAKAKLSDNPFYSEGTRLGRIAKLDQKFNDDVRALTGRQGNIQSRISGSKADIETQLNLQAKQFDINSAQVQTALSQFNTLLSAGALDNASGNDVAELTRVTGIPSSMIMSAIETSKASKVKERQTATISFDDGKDQGYAVIDTKTGEIISRQTVAASKPAASSGGSDKLSNTQEREVAVEAATVLKKTDTNKDKLLSLDEYKRALQSLIAATGVSQSAGDDILTRQMQALGYGKWRW